MLKQALAHHQVGHIDQAELAYKEILRLSPENPDALHFLGLIAYQNQDYDIATNLIMKAIGINPNNPIFFRHLGQTFQKQNKLDQAINSYQQAIKINPKYTEAYNNLGELFYLKNKLDQAINLFQKSISLNSNVASTHYLLGNLFGEKGEPSRAFKAYQKAIVLNPKHAEAHCKIGDIFQEQGNLDQAINSYHMALDSCPDLAEGHNNLGSVLKKKNQLDAAIVAFEKAIETNPKHVRAYSNLGATLVEKNKLEEATQHFEKALSLNPNFADVHFNQAIILLLQGRLKAGWEKYEWRWDSIQKSQKRDFKQLLWDGTSLKGKTILVHTEQGFGDAIQFVRYVDLVCDLDTTVIVECEAELKTLFKSIGRIDKLMTKGEKIHSFDVHVPLLSLPHIFGTTLKNIPAKIPYLYPDTKTNSILLSNNDHKFKIGIAWTGNPEHINDHNRSVDLKRFGCLLDVGDCEFFSLQVGEHSEDIKQCGYHHIIKDLGTQFTNFHHTALAILQLDLVISVDTAVAHLAGALGKPVWTLLPFMPDWRWMLNRSDSPWYPSMTLFRQKEIGNWTPVFEQLKLALTRCSQN